MDQRTRNSEGEQRLLDQRQWDLLEVVPDAIVVINRDGEMIYVNSQVTNMFGYRRDELVGQQVEILLPESLRTKHTQLRADYTANPSVRVMGSDLDLYGLHKDGRKIPVDICLSPAQAEERAFFVAAVRDVSSQKQLEQKLQEGQRFIQGIADATPNLLYVYDLIEHRNVYMNDQVTNILGYTPEEIQQMGTELIDSVVHPDDVGAVAAHLREMSRARDNEVLELEYRMKHGDGEWHWFLGRSVVFSRTDEGLTRQILGISGDITDRKHADQVLREAALFAETNPGPVLRFDENGVIVSMNPAAQSILGEDAKRETSLSSIGSTLAEIDAQKYIREGLLVECEATVGSRHFHFVVRGLPELGVGHVYGSDITDRKRVEQLQREAALFAETNPGPVLRFDESGGILSSNPAAQAILGYQAKEGSRLLALGPTLAAIDAKRVIREGLSVECETALGSRHFHFAIRGLPSLAVGHAYGSDITQLKRTEEELERANQRMREDLATAAKIQRSLLPKTAPRDSRVRFAWSFESCDELGGDIFDVLELDETHLGLYLLDVSGHGVTASLLSVALSRVLSPVPGEDSLIKARAEGLNYDIPRPAEVAKTLNKLFPMDLELGQYFTLLYGVLDLESSEFRYVCAGHPGPVYRAADGGSSILETPGFPIGFFREVEWEESVVRMKPGDCLYLYSDGVTEAASPDDEEFGKEQLVRTLDQSRGRPIQESLSALVQDVKQWHGGASQKDDISVLAFEVVG